MKILVIAEIGINHNGDMKICEKLMRVAAESGCDAVKFQKRDLNVVYTSDFLASSRESPWGSTQRDQKAGLEFGLDEYQQINQIASELHIEWFATV
jgi:N-acetylneuraminate synthase